MKSLKKLGFEKDTKLLIIHADDSGLSHSHNLATISSLNSGNVNSYSMMVPCPWFHEIAKFGKKNPNFDYGIHLTLTCEWTNYKFGPVLPAYQVPSLVDKYGFFHPTIDILTERASPMEIRKELIAQMDKAFQYGLNPSHLDSHMFSLISNIEFLREYLQMSRRYELPILLDEKIIKSFGAELIDEIDSSLFLVDYIHIAQPLNFNSGNLSNYYRDVLSNLKSGLNILLIHPAYNNSEMKGITAGSLDYGSEWRQIDFNYFSSSICKLDLKKNNIELINWSQIAKIDKKIKF